jgi:hypothetical protein
VERDRLLAVERERVLAVERERLLLGLDRLLAVLVRLLPVPRLADEPDRFAFVPPPVLDLLLELDLRDPPLLACGMLSPFDELGDYLHPTFRQAIDVAS